MKNFLGVLLLIMMTSQVTGGERAIPNFSFDSIDGGKINFNDFEGKVILITNTASKCGFTGQYRGLQELYDTYKAEGLIVFGVPSSDFRQEYKDSRLIKNFCEVNFGITFPMSEVTKVIGRDAHPFYTWLASEFNFTPRWNFNKILIDKNGKVVNTYGAMVKPNSDKITKKLVSLLKK